MEKIHRNTHVFVLSCKYLTYKHKNMRVSIKERSITCTCTMLYIHPKYNEECKKKTCLVSPRFSSFPDTSKLSVHGMYFSTLPVCIQCAHRLFAAICKPLGCGCSLDVGFVFWV